MGGQDGSARDPLSYDIGSDSVFAGLRFKPAERLSLGISGGYTQSDASIRPFDLSAPDFVATHPATAYDFSQSHLYSDLDITRVDAEADLTYAVAEKSWLSLRYRYADLQDDAPYLYDSRTTDPGTTPPPRTRSNSGIPVGIRSCCSPSTSKMEIGWEAPAGSEPFFLREGSGCTSSTNVFHSPQFGHFPIHRVDSKAHCWQTYVV